MCGPILELTPVVSTAKFVELIKCQSIVNVKTCNKGTGHRGELQSPITPVTSVRVQLLLDIVQC